MISLHFVDAKPLEELHHQNACCRHLAIDLRNDDEIAVPVDLGETLDVLGFVKKIHFFRNHTRELLNDRLRGPDDVVIDELLQNKNEVLNDTNVGSDQFFHPGPEDFYDHFRSVISGPVYLS